MDVKKDSGAELMSLEELSQEVAQRLSDRFLGQARDQRVSALPDARTIRYYTTLGLLDRPIISGRQARYNHRHVLQLLAVKALQNRQMPLAQVQEKLYGLNEKELSALLDTVAALSREITDETLPITAYREIIIEPGFKLVVAQGHQTKLTTEALRERIEIALKCLASSSGEV